MANKNIVTERVKELCKKNETTITQLCLDITGSKGNLATWNKGNIRNDYLLEISKRFNVSTDYLLGRTDDPSLSLDQQLEGVSFALYSETKTMSDEQKQDVLNFIRFIKEQEKK